MTLADVDFTDLDNFARGFPHDLFAIHRRDAPIYWHHPTEHTPDGEGFWSIASYAETLAVLKDPVTFSSVTGGDRPFGGTLLQDLSIAGQVLNMMDDPRHSQIRRLVSSGLTPRMIGLVEDDLRARTRRLLDDVVPGEPFDFLVDIAAELPMQMICILLGVPESERHWLFEAIEPQFDFGGSRTAALSQLSAEEAGSRMYTYGQELIASKRAQPTDDMLSVVANATLDTADGPAMSDLELYLFFSLLFSAGAETTRNAVAGGLLALAEHPEQLRLLREDLAALPIAVEEMVRWTSPSPSKRRTATRDVSSATCRSRRGRRYRSGKARPIAMHGCSTLPMNSISRESPTRTWVSVRVCITAWAPTWPGWNCECCSRNCCPASAPCGWCVMSSGRAATGTPGSGTLSSNCASAS